MGTDPLFAHFGREFPEGHVLFREGDAGSVMYVLHAGRVRITRTFATGERTLAILGPGDFFGEMAILNRKPRTATAVTLDPIRAIEIDARTLEAMVLGNGEIAVRLITRLARRLDAANQLVEILLHRDPRVKIVYALARLTEELGVASDEGVVLPVTTDEIARTADLALPDAFALLQRLSNVRVIRQRTDGSYLVPPLARLREFLDLIDTSTSSPRESIPSRMPLPVHGTEAPRGEA